MFDFNKKVQTLWEKPLHLMFKVGIIITHSQESHHDKDQTETHPS